MTTTTDAPTSTAPSATASTVSKAGVGGGKVTDTKTAEAALTAPATAVSPAIRRIVFNVAAMVLAFVAFNNRYSELFISHLQETFKLTDAYFNVPLYILFAINIINIVDALRIQFLGSAMPVQQIQMMTAKQRKLLGLENVPMSPLTTPMGTASTAPTSTTSSSTGIGVRSPNAREGSSITSPAFSSPRQSTKAREPTSPIQFLDITKQSPGTPVTTEKLASLSPGAPYYQTSPYGFSRGFVNSPPHVASGDFSYRSPTPQIGNNAFSATSPAATSVASSSSSFLHSPKSPEIKSPKSPKSPILFNPRSGTTPTKLQVSPEKLFNSFEKFQNPYYTNYTSTWGGYGNLDFESSTIPKYMTAVREPEPSTHPSPFMRSGGYSQDDLLNELGIYSEFEDWREQLRLWLSSGLIGKLVQRIELNDAVLDNLQLPNLKIRVSTISQQIIGVTPLPTQLTLPNGTRLRTIADLMMANPEMNKIITERLNLEAYVVLSKDYPRDYIVDRIKTLSQGEVLSSFSWNSGGKWGNREWKSDKLPTDAELVMHIFCTFFDEQLMLDNPTLQNTRPFTERHHISEVSGPAKDLDSLGSIILRRVSKYPPYWNLLIQMDGKKKTWEVSQGHYNMFDTMLLFLYYVKRYQSGYLRSLNLSGKSIGLLNTLRSFDETII